MCQDNTYQPIVIGSTPHSPPESPGTLRKSFWCNLQNDWKTWESSQSSLDPRHHLRMEGNTALFLNAELIEVNRI